MWQGFRTRHWPYNRLDSVQTLRLRNASLMAHGQIMAKDLRRRGPRLLDRGRRSREEEEIALQAAKLLANVWTAVNVRMRGMQQFVLIPQQRSGLRRWRRDVVRAAGLDMGGLDWSTVRAARQQQRR